MRAACIPNAFQIRTISRVNCANLLLIVAALLALVSDVDMQHHSGDLISAEIDPSSFSVTHVLEDKVYS
jgi:hypothetical protein